MRNSKRLHQSVYDCGTKDIPKNILRRKTDIYFDVLEVIDTVDNTHTAELGEQIHTLMQQSLDKYK